VPPRAFPKKLKFLFQPYRYKICWGGRGGLKSWTIGRALLTKGASGPIRVLCGRETQSSIQDSVHQLLSDQIGLLGLESVYTVTDHEINGTNGTLFRFAGLRQQDITKIKSFEGFDIAWLEEAQAISDKSFSILIPTIRKPGSEIWISFNPELDTDPVYRRFIRNTPPDSKVVFTTFKDNPWMTKEMELERLHLKEHDPEEYKTVWLGQCRRVVPGAIYHDEVIKAYEEKRVRPVPYDPLLNVHTVWDLGL